MAKPLKIILIVFGALLFLIVAAAIALPLLFDPNSFRGKVSDAAREETGRELTVGNIELHVFPWLQVGVADAKLGNAQGFGAENFAEVRELSVGVKLLPLLFHRQVQVSSVKLDGLRLNLAVNKEGVSNWQDLIDHQKQQEEKPAEPTPESEGIRMEDIDISGIDISDAAIRYSDAQGGKAYRVEALNLQTGALSPGEPFDVDLSLTALSDAPKAAADLTLKAMVEPDLDHQKIAVKDARLGFKSKTGEPAIEAEGELAAQILADLAAQVFTIDGLKLDATAAGKSIPGGKQAAKLSGALRYDQKNGTLSFDNGVVQLANATLNTQIKGEGLNSDQPRLSGPISIAQFSPRDLLKQLGIALDTADANALSATSLKAEYRGSFKTAALRDLQIKLDDTTVQGELAVTDFATQALEFALKADAIDVDRYLPPKKEGESKSETQGGGDVNDIKLPTEALDKLNANGSLDIGQMTVNGIKLADVRLKLSGSGKSAKTQDLSARLYGGTVSLNNRYAAEGAPTFALKTDLASLNAAPFLQDLLGKDYVSGLGNMQLDLTSRGATVGELRKALNGTVAVKVENGAVKGFNLGQILRQGQAMLAGQAAPSESAPLQTDFAALTASGTIANGVLSTNDLAAASPAFRLAGSGQIDLANETIRFTAKPTVVETTQGQGGKGLDQLKGLTVPIEISGDLFSPKYKLDLEDVLKDKAKEQLKNQLAKELDLPKGQATDQQLKEKAAEKLGDLLFGNKKKKDKQPQQTPAPATSAPPT
ncbi:MAG: AsmA family protein [Sinimarinibacterium sp.]|jgi:AsmA protein